MQELKLTLTIDEANLILEALGQMPFKTVFGLINKIQTQASQQLGNDGKTDTPKQKIEKPTNE